MRKLCYWHVCAIALAFALLTSAAVAQITNPSFETGNLSGWTTYSYVGSGNGQPATPEVKVVGTGGFTVAIPSAPADGTYVCGFECWGDTKNGGVYQSFTAPVGSSYVLVSGRAYSLDWGMNPADGGMRVRAGLVNGVSTDRSSVTEWVTAPWGPLWSDIVIPVVPGTQYTLFIESSIPWASGPICVLWDNVRFAGAVVKIAVNPVVTSTTETTATIEWDTDVASSSIVMYDTDGPVYDNTATGASGIHHVVTLTGLTPGTVYHYAVKSEAPPSASATSADAILRTVPTPETTFTNGDFEATNGGAPTLSPWYMYGIFDGLVGPETIPADQYSIPGSWHGQGAVPHGGNYFAGAATSYLMKTNAGVFQRVHAAPNSWYKAQTWIWTFQQGGGAYDVNCMIGIDPNGDIDPNGPNVVWSSAQYTQKWDTAEQLGWKRIGTVAKSGSNGIITVFLKTKQNWGLAWNIMCFDDVTLETESSTNPIDYLNHIGKAKVYLGRGYPVTLSGKTITKAWQEPGKSYCYIQEEDRSSGIRVDLSGVGVVAMPGGTIDVTGTMDYQAEELQISPKTAVTHDPAPDAKLPDPLYVTGKLVATGVLGGQQALTSAGGLSNVGVRVRVSGKVTGWKVGDYGYCVYIDDGSGVVLNDSLVGPDPQTYYPGIKVLFDNWSMVPPIGGIASAVGVAGIGYDSTTGAFPLVRCGYSDTDFTVYQDPNQ